MRKLLMVVLAGVVLMAGCGKSDDTASNEAGGTTATTAHGGATDTSCASQASTTVKVVAKNTSYDTACLAVPAGQSFTLTLDNEDNGLSHSLAILASHESSQVFASTGIFSGVKMQSVTVTPDKLPGKGTYHFHCEVHPDQMNGTFIVT